MGHARSEDKQTNKIRATKTLTGTEGNTRLKKEDLVSFSPSFSSTPINFYGLKPRTKYPFLCGLHHYEEVPKVLRILFLRSIKLKN